MSATLEELQSRLEILLRFYKFKDWRIVETKDELGNIIQCLLLPMERNGIRMTDDGKYPYMRLLIHGASGKDGFIRTIRPFIPHATHDRLVANGEMDPDDVNWAEMVGGIRPLLWASTEKKGWGDFKSSIDKFYGLKKNIKSDL